MSKGYSLKKGNPSELIIKIKKVPVFILVCFWIMLVVLVLMPLAGIGSAITLGDKIGFGFLVFLIIDGFIIRFLVRTICWNSFGFERWLISESKVSYQADYKYFKGPLIVVEPKYTFSYNHRYEEEKDKARLVVKNEEKQIASVIELPTEEIVGLIKRLQ